MSIYDATFAVIDALEQAKIAYMLSGSLSSMYYSFPRATVDADFVLDLGESNLSALAELLGPGFRVDLQMAFEAVGGTTKNVVDVVGSPFKIKLFRLSSQPFDRQRFSRRVRVNLLGRKIWIPTPEDVIVQKMIWNRPKDREDVLGVIAANRMSLDRDYLNHWCGELGVRDAFDELWTASPDLRTGEHREESDGV